MNSLLASGAWSLDVIFFLLIFIGIMVGVMRGFIAGISKIFGTIFAVAVAITSCVSFQKTLNNWTGATTAINHAIRAPVGDWIMTVIAFILLVVLVKLAAWLLGKFGTGIANATKPTRVANMALGGLLGAAKAFLIIFLLLALFQYIPTQSVHDFFGSSCVVGKIYNSEWFCNAIRFKF